MACRRMVGIDRTVSVLLKLRDGWCHFMAQVGLADLALQEQMRGVSSLSWKCFFEKKIDAGT